MHTFFVSLKSKFKEAYLLPGLSLFIIPLIYFPFLHSSFTAGKELTFKSLLLLALVILLSIGLRQKKLEVKKIGDSTLFLLLVAVLVLHALSNFLSGNPLVTMVGTFSRGVGFIFELYLFAFLVWNAFSLEKESIAKVLKCFWASALLVALYGCMQKLGLEWFFQNYATNLFQGRIFSFSGNPSLLGQLMLLSTIVGTHLALAAQTKKGRVLFGFGTFIMILALFLSGTRSAVLGLLAAAFLGVLRYRKELWNVLKKLSWKLLLLLPLLTLVFFIAPTDRFSLSNLSLRSLNSRFEIWKGTIQLIEDKWLLGYGQETFYIHFPEVVTKDFLTLEEDISISADRVHNEWLEEIYNHGIPAGLLYLVLLGFLLKKIFAKNSPEEFTLATLLLANSVQNQLSFPDTSILVLVAFAWGALVAMEAKKELIPNPLYPYKKRQIFVGASVIFFLTFVGYHTVLRPLFSHQAYTTSKENTDYATSVNALKDAIIWTPYYSELWYELMFIDPSSMGRALANLEAIDGESGDVLAWKGNFNSQSDPQLAADYYLAALEKNPYQPNWIRAFADMLYTQGDCETALFLYDQYVEAVPEYWKWSVDLESHTETEQKSYETFFKHVPYFFGTLEKMETCRKELEGESEGVTP